MRSPEGAPIESSFSAVEIRLRSSLPGRVRWEAPKLIGHAALCSLVESALHAEPGVQSTVVSPTTGRVLLEYDARFPVQRYEQTLASTIRDAPLDSLIVRREPTRKHALLPFCTDEAHPVVQLSRLMSRHKARAILALVVAFIDRLFEAAPPALIGMALDIVTKKSSSSFLAKLGFRTLRSQLFAFSGLFAVVWTVDACMGYFHRVTSARLAEVVEDDLRQQVYTHLQSLDVGQLEGRPVSAWTSLFDSDISRIGTFIETGIDPIVTMVTNGLVVTTTFVMQAPALFMTQLMIIPGLYFVSTNLLDPIRKRHEAEIIAGNRLSDALRSNVAGMSTIAVFKTQELEAQRIARLTAESGKASVQRAEVTAAFIPAIHMVVGVGFLTTLVWGGTLVEQGKISMASYNVMGFMSLRLLVALGSLGMSLAEYQRTTLALEHIRDFLARRSRIADGPRPLPPGGAAEVVFENVAFQYEPGRPVLQDLGLRISSGHTTGIVGHTGAGKTTLLKLILRFYDIQSGSILVNGNDIRDLKVDDLRGLISLVAQQPFLFNGTVRENISYARPDASIEEVQSAAKVAQAHDFIMALPKGYNTRISGEGGLSGGEQQRIAIARAILADRSLLLFDEATSAVDYETEAGIQKALAEVTASRTTIIVAHRLSTVRNADWIYVLDEGRVSEQGRHEDLIEKQGIYANLWRVQTGEKPIALLPEAPTTETEPSAESAPSTESEPLAEDVGPVAEPEEPARTNQAAQKKGARKTKRK